MNNPDNARSRQAVIDVMSGRGGEIKGNAAPDHEMDLFKTSISSCGEVQLSCHFVAWAVLDFSPSPLEIFTHLCWTAAFPW